VNSAAQSVNAVIVATSTGTAGAGVADTGATVSEMPPVIFMEIQ